VITDSHFGARSDAVSFLDYFSKFYDNVFFPYLDKHGIDTILHLGDIVDRRKFINYVTLNRLKDKFLTPIIKRNIDFHCIVGNHDIPYRNTNDINALRELFEGMNVPNINCYWEPKELSFDGCDILMMPWINRQNYDDSLQAMVDTKAQICMGHFEISGFEVMRGIKHDHGMDSNLFNKFELVCSGHFHHRHTKGNIHYLGSPYEIFWSDYNASRGFHVFDTETRELEFIQNPNRIFYKIVYNDENKSLEEAVNYDFQEYVDTYVKVIVQEKTNPYAFDLFMDKLYKADPINVSIVDDHKHLDKQPDEEIVNEAEDTLTILTKFVDNLQFEGDNAQLNTLIRELYNEASTIEV
jgi:DNA repair exonuclease SbcCD nuclease subunit